MKTASLVVALAVICAVASPQVSAKKFSKCQLATALAKNGIARADLPNWVCLVQSESGSNTATVGGPNKNKTKDWGLFQINDGYWCKDGRSGGDCNVNCRCEFFICCVIWWGIINLIECISALIDENIADDVKCAKMIFKRHGYKAWYGWRNKCQGKTLPSVNECF